MMGGVEGELGAGEGGGSNTDMESGLGAGGGGEWNTDMESGGGPICMIC